MLRFPRYVAAGLALVVLLGVSPAGAQEFDAPSAPSHPETGLDAGDQTPDHSPSYQFDVPGSLGAEDGVPLGFVTPDGESGGVGAVGGLGLGVPVALGAADALAPGVSSVPVTDDYLQVTQMLEQDNLARRALEASEKARREAEQKRILEARNRPDRVPDSVPYASAFNDAAAVRSLDPRMLAAVAKVASDLKAGAGCPSGARRGLMGLTPDVAASYGVDPCDPASAVGASALLLSGLYERYGSWDPALAAFRVGAAQVDRAKGVPAAAKGFVDRVKLVWESYKNPPKDPSSGGSPSDAGYARPPKGTVTAGPSGPICTTRAAGFTVACHVAGQVSAMVAAAAGDGVRLSGGSYRSNASQIQLRRAHCGPSQYDIYQKPSSQCRPPTARPGASMHERGLAIDFNACSSRSTACHQWLKSNASRFGYFNLPSEPWHWSTNGN